MMSFSNSVGCFQPVYQYSSQSVHEWLSISLQGFPNMAAAAILENGVGSSLLSSWIQQINIGSCTKIHQKQIKNGSDTAFKVFSTWRRPSCKMSSDNRC
jgi:hypothetical protein